MALEHGLVTVTLVAGEDLSAKQYYIVGPDANKEAMLADGSGPLFNMGVLQNKPKDTEAGTVAVGGITKVVVGGNVSAGDPIKPDGSTGKAVEQTSGESIGRIMEDAVDGQIASLFLVRETI